MSYGVLLDRARVYLRDAAIDEAHGDIARLVGLPVDRWYVYRQLHRHVNLLTGTTLRRPPEVALAFSEALDGAAGRVDGPSSPARGHSALSSAGNCLGVAADLLATHASGGRAHTPTGAAILAGGGVAAALADLGRLALDAIAVDLAVKERTFSGQHIVLESLHAAAVAAGRPATTGPLAHWARELATVGAGSPPLLRSLEVAPLITAEPEMPVRTAADAANELNRAVTWLWQNPRELRAEHLRLATRLGHAVGLLHRDSAVVRVWKAAAAAAHQVSGSPPLDAGWRVVETVRTVGRWATDALDHHSRPDVVPLATQLPELAETLLGALPSAIHGRHLLTSRPELRRRPGSVITHAVDVWHRASMNDDPITELRAALERASAGSSRRTAGPTSPARRAFKTPPQPGLAVPVSPSELRRSKGARPSLGRT